MEIFPPAKPRRSTASRPASQRSAAPSWRRRPPGCARAPRGRASRLCCRRPSPWCGRPPKGRRCGAGKKWKKMLGNEGKRYGKYMEIYRLNYGVKKGWFLRFWRRRWSYVLLCSIFKRIVTVIINENLVDSCVLMFISVYNFIHAIKGSWCFLWPSLKQGSW